MTPEEEEASEERPGARAEESEVKSLRFRLTSQIFRLIWIIPSFSLHSHEKENEIQA